MLSYNSFLIYLARNNRSWCQRGVTNFERSQAGPSTPPSDMPYLGGFPVASGILGYAIGNLRTTTLFKVATRIAPDLQMLGSEKFSRPLKLVYGEPRIQRKLFAGLKTSSTHGPWRPSLIGSKLHAALVLSGRISVATVRLTMEQSINLLCR